MAGWQAFKHSVAQPLRNWIERLRHPPETRDALHRYWYAPDDHTNLPEHYLLDRTVARSEFLVSLIEKHIAPGASIMEIGCNVGRNLSFLHRAGFTRLVALEISLPAIEKFRATFPEVAAATQIHNAPVEDVIRTLGSDSVDLVFTMAVLEHIHPDSEWVFREMVRTARLWLITIEDEAGVSKRHFPRNYRKVFEGLGMTQTEEVTGMARYGLPDSFVARVFQKAVRRA